MVDDQPLRDIANPHDHDVLSGRGNFVNYHAGNEYFRALVRKHKLAYVACPKQQKGKFSRLIVDEIRNRNPPGRFLKQDPGSKLWHDIGDKKALDKTRQALREGAPEIMKELADGSDEEQNSPVADGPSHPIEHAVPFGRPGAPGHPGPPGVFGADATRNPAMVLRTVMPATIGGPIVVPGHPAAGMHQQVLPVGNGLLMSAPQVSQVDGVVGSASVSGVDAASGSMGPPAIIPQNTSPIGASADSFDELNELQRKYNATSDAFEPRPIDPNLAVRMQHSSRQGPTSSNSLKGSQRPPLGRDDSLKFDKVFLPGSLAAGAETNTTSSKPSSGNKPDLDGSSMMHLSATSFSVGEMTQETILSNVFDNSVRISENGRRKDDKTSLFDMSMATINDKLSDAGNMSFATFGERMTESQANMSFSCVFEETEK